MAMLQQYTRTSPKRSKIVIDDYQDVGGHGSIETRYPTPCVFQGNCGLQEITHQRTPVWLRDLELRAPYGRSGGVGAFCLHRLRGTIGATSFGVECLGGNVNGGRQHKGERDLRQSYICRSSRVTRRWSPGTRNGVPIYLLHE